MMIKKTRRDVFKTLALGGGAFLLSPATPFASGRAKDKLGVALVGLGYYSTDLLAPALQQTRHCYLAGVVTGSSDKAATWKAKYNIPEKNIYNYGNFDQIANNPDIDVVYVVLPPSMHKEYVVRAAKAGKHVWCEKPMAVTEKDCQEMIDACRSNKKSLSIGYRLQHESTTQIYRKMVQRQSLGKVKHLTDVAAYHESRTDHWKQKLELGGGVIYDMGVYAIQGARLGTGLEPVSVVTAANTIARPEIYKNGLTETITATLAFPGGVTADIRSSFYENANSLNITCDKGTIAVAPYSSYAGLRMHSPMGDVSTSYDVPFQQATQMDDDAISILQNKPMLVPGEEGLRDIRIVEAILKSIANKGTEVTL